MMSEQMLQILCLGICSKPENSKFQNKRVFFFFLIVTNVKIHQDENIALYMQLVG